MSINIEGIDKGELLAALHNGTKALGLGKLHDIRRNLTPEEGRELYEDLKGPSQVERKIPGVIIAGRPEGVVATFDYVLGRPLKVMFTEKELLREDMYDRDCPTGEGSCARIVAQLKVKSK